MLLYFPKRDLFWRDNLWLSSILFNVGLQQNTVCDENSTFESDSRGSHGMRLLIFSQRGYDRGCDYSYDISLSVCDWAAFSETTTTCVDLWVWFPTCLSNLSLWNRISSAWPHSLLSSESLSCLFLFLQGVDGYALCNIFWCDFKSSMKHCTMEHCYINLLYLLEEFWTGAGRELIVSL